MPYVTAKVVIFCEYFFAPLEVINMKILVKSLNHALNIESKRN